MGVGFLEVFLQLNLWSFRNTDKKINILNYLLKPNMKTIGDRKRKEIAVRNRKNIMHNKPDSSTIVFSFLDSLPYRIDPGWIKQKENVSFTEGYFRPEIKYKCQREKNNAKNNKIICKHIK